MLRFLPAPSLPRCACLTAPRWFNFRMSGVRGQPLTLHIVNAGDCSFPSAWEGYQTAASYDLKTWFRCAAKDAHEHVHAHVHSPVATNTPPPPLLPRQGANRVR